MTDEQALNILKMGHNVYITGAPGSGKTYLLNKYINFLKNKGVDVGVTASTGIAATHIGGVTIHSWTGLGIRDSLSPYDLEALQEKQYLWKRFEKVKVLVIDEVSMLHDFRLDLIEKVCREFKRNQKPFGGIQVVLCGDFFQLPPVTKSFGNFNKASFNRGGQPSLYGEEQSIQYGDGQIEPQPPNQSTSPFVYNSSAWRSADFKICYLSGQHRQTDDITVSILNEIRMNKISGKFLEILKGRMVVPESTRTDQEARDSNNSVFESTRLYTHNIDVDSINERELQKLVGDEKTFEMIDRGNNELLVDLLKKSCLAPQKMKLKTGARVMFIKNNFEGGYVNGTLGSVVALGKNGPVVKTHSGQLIDVEPASWKIEEDGKVKAEIIQYPLRLAWAITIHKSQGMSLDRVEVDLSKSFERGMGYVALSRVRSIEGLRLLGLNDLSLKVSDEVLQYDEELRVKSEEAVEMLTSMMLTDEKAIKNKQMEFLKRIGANDLDPDSDRDSYNKFSKNGGKNNSYSQNKSSVNKWQKKKATHDITKDLLAEGRSLSEISRIRNLKTETIVDHLEVIVLADNLADLSGAYETLPKNKQDRVGEAFKKAHKNLADNLADSKNDFKKITLAPVKHLLGSDITYVDLRIVRMMLFQESKMV